MNYNVYLATFNGQETIKEVIESIMSQTLRPRNVFVYNDNSLDNTYTILEEMKKYYDNLYTLHDTVRHTYDVSRLPKNLNKLFIYAESLGIRNTDYELITSDDIVFRDNYVNQLMRYMLQHKKCVIVSGNETHFKVSNTPRGAGRLIDSYFFNQLCKGRFIEDLSFESSLVLYAIINGLQATCINGLTFTHLRENGAKHNFKGYGQTMKTLGYTPLYVFGRCLKNTISPNEFPRKKAIKIFIDYLISKPKPIYDDRFKQEVKKLQYQKIRSYL